MGYNVRMERDETQPTESDGLSEMKHEMYNFIDTLSDDQVHRLLQIAHAAFEK